MKGKDSFKGMPSWKGKGEGDGKNKGGKPFQQQQPPQANVAQQASSSASQAPEKPETAHAEESWSYDYDTYWTDDWSGYESYYGYDGDYSRGDWYNWSYFAFVEELTASEDKHSESFDFVSEDGQTDQINRFCFSAICLFRYLGHELVEAFASVLLFVSLLYQCFSDLNRFSIESIRHVEDSVATDSGDMHSFPQHTSPLSSVTTEECVYLNYDHGAQQALLVNMWIFVLIRLMRFLTQVVPELWDPALPSIASYKHANNIKSVIRSGFPNNRLQVSFHLQMENNLQLRKDLPFTFAMIMHALVGLPPALTFWTKVRFQSSFQLNRCGTFV